MQFHHNHRDACPSPNRRYRNLINILYRMRVTVKCAWARHHAQYTLVRLQPLFPNAHLGMSSALCPLPRRWPSQGRHGHGRRPARAGRHGAAATGHPAETARRRGARPGEEAVRDPVTSALSPRPTDRARWREREGETADPPPPPPSRAETSSSARSRRWAGPTGGEGPGEHSPRSVVM